MDNLESQHRKIIIVLVVVILAGGGYWMLKHFHPALFLGEPDLIVETEAAPPLSTPPPTTSSGPSVSPQPAEGRAAPSDGVRININTATAQELQTLRGIGPALAQRIIEYRQTSGRFSTVDDLANVKGIGEKTLDKLRDSITVY